MGSLFLLPPCRASILVGVWYERPLPSLLDTFSMCLYNNLAKRTRCSPSASAEGGRSNRTQLSRVVAIRHTCQIYVLLLLCDSCVSCVWFCHRKGHDRSCSCSSCTLYLRAHSLFGRCPRVLLLTKRLLNRTPHKHPAQIRRKKVLPVG